eukprot:4910763-Amphidinium_carterae.1
MRPLSIFQTCTNSFLTIACRFCLSGVACLGITWVASSVAFVNQLSLPCCDLPDPQNPPIPKTSSKVTQN